MTPPPLTDCFLLSLLLNYFSSDSHMWVFSSLAGRLTLWRRESEAQQTGEASVCFKRERETQCMCQCQRKTGAGSRDVAPTPLFLLRLRSCGALPPPSPTVAAPSWAKNGPNSWPKRKRTINSSFSHIAHSLPCARPNHNSSNCSNRANINTSPHKESIESRCEKVQYSRIGPRGRSGKERGAGLRVGKVLKEMQAKM